MALAPPERTDKSSRRSPPERFLEGLPPGALCPLRTRRRACFAQAAPSLIRIAQEGPVN